MYTTYLVHINVTFKNYNNIEKNFKRHQKNIDIYFLTTFGKFLYIGDGNSALCIVALLLSKLRAYMLRSACRAGHCAAPLLPP